MWQKYSLGYQCSLKNCSFMIIDEEEESAPLDLLDTADAGKEDQGAILDVCLSALANQLQMNTITLFEVL